MNPITFVPLDALSGINTAASQGQTAAQSVGATIVICVLVVLVWKARGGLAALFAGGIAAAFAWWLIKMGGLNTLGSVWDSTIKQYLVKG